MEGGRGPFLCTWAGGCAASPPWVWMARTAPPPGAPWGGSPAGSVRWESWEGSAQAVEAGRARGRGASGLGEGGSAGGAPGGRAGLLRPAVHASAPRVHEEIADGVELQAELLRDGDLHFLGRSLVLLEDGDQRAPLQVGEHQALLLGLQRALLLLLLLLPLAGCGRVAASGWAGERETAPPRGRARGARETWTQTRAETEGDTRKAEIREMHRNGETAEGQGRKRQGHTEMSIGRATWKRPGQQ